MQFYSTTSIVKCFSKLKHLNIYSQSSFVQQRRKNWNLNKSQILNWFKDSQSILYYLHFLEMLMGLFTQFTDGKKDHREKKLF